MPMHKLTKQQMILLVDIGLNTVSIHGEDNEQKVNKIAEETHVLIHEFLDTL